MSGPSIVVEFLGSDHRPLGRRDAFLTGSFSEEDVAVFYTESAAQAAVVRAKNKRPGGEISIIGRAQKAAA